MQKNASSDKLGRICLVISSLSGGGAERVLVGMANYWAERGKKIYLITFSEKDEKPFYDLHESIKHKQLGMKAVSSSIWESIRNNWLRIKVLRCTITDARADVVISFMDNMNVLVLLATLGLKIPVVISERIDPTQYSIGMMWENLRLLLYSRARCLVVQSKSAMEWAVQNWSNLAIEIIHNPIVIRKKKNESTSPLPSGKWIIAVGRLEHQKGFDLLLSAYSKAKKLSDNDVKLAILGEGGERAYLEELIKNYNLESFVWMPGQVENIEDYYSNALMYVLSSRFEGFPNVLLEAMACGAPVISFDCPSGPGEIIENGINGVLVPPEDINALSGAITHLLIKKEERRRLGHNAKQVQESFRLEKIMKKWEDVLCEVVN